ncbi:MAG TPA: hypothetical protein VFG20_16895 [Planctomycetaceae bacterium]|nr:hypothetical protein [Planctomycetaceae bacterium]
MPRNDDPSVDELCAHFDTLFGQAEELHRQLAELHDKVNQQKPTLPPDQPSA